MFRSVLLLNREERRNSRTNCETAAGGLTNEYRELKGKDGRQFGKWLEQRGVGSVSKVIRPGLLRGRGAVSRCVAVYLITLFPDLAFNAPDSGAQVPA